MINQKYLRFIRLGGRWVENFLVGEDVPELRGLANHLCVPHLRGADFVGVPMRKEPREPTPLPHFRGVGFGNDPFRKKVKSKPFPHFLRMPIPPVVSPHPGSSLGFHGSSLCAA
jgi:hypothetical protein